MKTSVHCSDEAYAGLVQLAYNQGFVRGVRPTDRPRGLSAFVSTLAAHKWTDTRPDYMQGTGQWVSGMSPRRERCLHLSPNAVADLGRLALEWHIFPYKTQAPVANGFRREATIPVLHPVGRTPPGRTSVRALVGPVLEAIGLGYLSPAGLLSRAPVDLYQTPSRRYETHARRRALARSEAL